MHRHDESLFSGLSTDHNVVFCEKILLKLSFVLKMHFLFICLFLTVRTAFQKRKEKTTYAKKPLPVQDTTKYEKLRPVFKLMSPITWLTSC